MQNSTGKKFDYQPDFELIGFTGRRVILAAGEDRGMTVGRLIDADELRRSPMFERLAPRDRRLVVELVNGCAA
jgi:hypothetical protein